jgi:hypothetical protein
MPSQLDLTRHDERRVAARHKNRRPDIRLPLGGVMTLRKRRDKE